MESRLDVPARLLRDCRRLLPDCGSGTLPGPQEAGLQRLPDLVLSPNALTTACTPSCRELSSSASVVCEIVEMSWLPEHITRPRPSNSPPPPETPGLGESVSLRFVCILSSEARASSGRLTYDAAICFEYRAESATGLQCTAP